MEKNEVAEDMGISLHAFTSIDDGQAMKLQITINNTTVAALVDLGSTHVHPERFGTAIGSPHATMGGVYQSRWQTVIISTALVSMPMDVLLDIFVDLFEVPRGLPPQCRHDHRIRLLPGAAPVAVQPYRYPQLLKDEIERQCEDMLQQGIIQPSTSAFSSPVLLVKKHVGSWRFCVDYRS